MNDRPGALIGSLFMLVGIIALFVAVASGVVYFEGLNPTSLGDLGLVSIFGYPLVGRGAFIVLVAGIVMIVTGSSLHD